MKGIFCLISNLFDRFFIIEPTQKELFGYVAEVALKRILNGYHAFHNVILKSPYNDKHFLEIDSIVLYNDTIFCIEIKNYKGTIYYAANYKNDEFTSYKQDRIIQLKQDSHLNQVYKELPNPIEKTKFFSKQLKAYLIKLDRRFLQLKFESIAVFFNKSTDISNLSSLDDNFIYLSYLSEFIKSKAQNLATSDWAIPYLENLPTFDKIITKNNQTIHGILIGNYIQCTNPTFKLELKNIKNIYIEQKIYNCKAKLIIEYKNSTKNNLYCQKMDTLLDKFGVHQNHKLSNIKQVVVGTHNIRPF